MDQPEDEREEGHAAAMVISAMIEILVVMIPLPILEAVVMRIPLHCLMMPVVKIMRERRTFHPIHGSCEGYVLHYSNSKTYSADCGQDDQGKQNAQCVR